MSEVSIKEVKQLKESGQIIITKLTFNRVCRVTGKFLIQDLGNVPVYEHNDNLYTEDTIRTYSHKEYVRLIEVPKGAKYIDTE